MGLNSGAAAHPTTTLNRRRAIRYVAAALAGVTAAMYFLIGFGMVSVLDRSVLDIAVGATVVDLRLQQAYFAIPAGFTFAFGMLLLLVFDRRLLWIVGALLQVFIMYTYVDLAAERTPAFEAWGMLILISQLLLLGVLMRLALYPPAQARA